MRRKQNLVLLVSKKKIGGNHAFFRDNLLIKLQFRGKKMPYIVLYFTAFLNYCCLIISEKSMVTPQFSFWISIALAKICYSCIRSHKQCKNTSVLVLRHRP